MVYGSSIGCFIALFVFSFSFAFVCDLWEIVLWYSDASHRTWKEKKEFENRKVVSLGGKVRTICVRAHSFWWTISVACAMFLPWKLSELLSVLILNTAS